MSDLRDLYQEVILDHGRKPRNFREIENADRNAAGFNPLCGDKVKIFLNCDDETLDEIAFQGSGCAISMASASILTQILKGKSRKEAEEIASRFYAMVTGEPGQEIDAERLGKLAAFAGVCEFPNRVKCATLAWHTLRAALDDNGDAVSTE
jgi:nitrogen fixation NifU-like protein